MRAPRSCCCRRRGFVNFRGGDKASWEQPCHRPGARAPRGGAAIPAAGCLDTPLAAGWWRRLGAICACGKWRLWCSGHRGGIAGSGACGWRGPYGARCGRLRGAGVAHSCVPRSLGPACLQRLAELGDIHLLQGRGDSSTCQRACGELARELGPATAEYIARTAIQMTCVQTDIHSGCKACRL